MAIKDVRDIHAYTPEPLIEEVRSQLAQGRSPAVIYANLSTRPPTDFGAGPGFEMLVPIANLLRTMAGWGPRP